MVGMMGPGPKLCRTCEMMGMHTPATRILPSGGGRCEEHYRKEAGLPPLRSASGKEIHSIVPAAAAAERENTVKKEEDGRGTKLDVAAMQADREAGMSGAKVAEKYKCSVATVWAYTKKTTVTHRPTIAEKAAAAPVLGGGMKAKRGRPRKFPASTPGGGFDDDILKHLRERRE